MIYGVDASNHQPHFDFAAARRDGIDFAFLKASEGTTFRDPNFARHLAAARAAGMLTAAYHYVRGDDVRGQLAIIRSAVDTHTPVILDVEDGAGPLASIRELSAALVAAGYRTPLIYLPQWYWSGRMGSPDLSGLPPLWHSRYPDNVVRRKEQFALGDEYWPSFGGLRTEIAQFTSSLAVANYPSGRIDGNAYRGSREELAALLEGEVVPSAQEIAKAVIAELKSATAADTNGDGKPDRDLVDQVKQSLWNSGDALAVVLRLETKVDAARGELSDFESGVLAAMRQDNATISAAVREQVAASVAATLPRSVLETALILLDRQRQDAAPATDTEVQG
ncbi:glycoside hydrolase family 25 protein [Actinosynnema mirum]|uniref:Glycoside hydrolase family 25 n=1 Tax=Actinosynnema mirum (strain ATCC 29888 / DSM 43827 / JCM 3225 / NBRC 14064 / NCIMB 13271 / NRRL B-12336 / IMRU 3971 / 101) TaxID=446462 RepID=C6WC71_ACTMD|nr:glycoside hydrolase family 25 protein [Actinosynnema mirum]ACU39459.1 glycoside hydrolase family 25 [Actinosynnema mirum DSM 43827]